MVASNAYTVSWSRVASAAIGILYISIAAIMEGLAGAGMVALFVAIPLSCIWFPDILAEYAPNSSSFFGIVRKTPEAVVSLAGWALLLLPALVPLLVYVLTL